MPEQEELLFCSIFLGIKNRMAKGNSTARDTISQLKKDGAKELTMKLIVDGKEAGHRASGIVFDTSLDSTVGWMEERGGNIITNPKGGFAYYDEGIAKTPSEAYNRMMDAAVHTYLDAKNIVIELGYSPISV